uniref:Uncharacterized protein n=1 Tax=Anguilla anguilla TaxID=7936 RepID=A0A0E9PRJ6_ANGAN
MRTFGFTCVTRHRHTVAVCAQESLLGDHGTYSISLSKSSCRAEATGAIFGMSLWYEPSESESPPVTACV